jgi:NAD+ kinase
MKKIGVIVNTKRPRAEGILSEFRQISESYGFSLFTENREMARILNAEYLPLDDFSKKVDVVIAMGGDGTMLYVARAVHGTGIPIMGINLGSLGYLTSVGDTEMEAALDAISTQDYRTEKREMAWCQIFEDDKIVGEDHALNDLVLGWGTSSRIVTLLLSVDGEPVGTFMCDGIIITTSTGSTGHSLSAGGPILHPGIFGFGINVICPHTLASRPLVVPCTSVITVEIVNAAKELILAVDGQDRFNLKKGGKIEIQRSMHPAKFIQLPGHSYFSVLSQKLHWRGSSI